MSDRPWHTPSHLRVDEAAQIALSRGRHLHHLQVLIAAIRDPRLGTSPIPVQLLAEVIDCAGGRAVALPGLAWLHDQIERHRRGRSTRLSRDGVYNAATLLVACGYLVSERRGAEHGERAVAHYATTLPRPDDLEAAITEWCRTEGLRRRGRSPSAPSDLTQGVDRDPTPGVTSDPSDLTPGVTSDPSDLTPGVALTSRPACSPPIPPSRDPDQRILQQQLLPGDAYAPQMDLSALRARLVEAAGSCLASEATAPGLSSMGEPVSWLAQGASLELYILPAIRAVAARPRRTPVASWRFFAGAVADAKAARERALPTPNRAAAGWQGGGAQPRQGGRVGGAEREPFREDPDQPSRYAPSSAEAQAYIAQAERAGEPEATIARYRQHGLKLRPSEARRIMAGGRIGAQPVAAVAAPILRRLSAAQDDPPRTVH